MKKNIFGIFTLLVFFGVGCTSTQTNLGVKGLSAGLNESEIIIKRPGKWRASAVKMNIYVNGKLSLILGNGDEGFLIVPNGNHIINAEMDGVKSEYFSVDLNSSRITILATFKDVSATRVTIILEKTDEIALSPTRRSPPRNTQNSGIVQALNNAAGIVMNSMQKTTIMAIVNVSSNDNELSIYVVNELEYILVNNGFTIVDRRELDKIRSEQRFQLSGEIDDNTIVSIGKFAGANMVITGAITGTGETRRLRLRVLNTQTAQVMSVASESF